MIPVSRSPSQADAWHRLLAWPQCDGNDQSLCQILAHVNCSTSELDLKFRLLWTPGPSGPIVPPRKLDASGLPQRCDGLWQHTCFELFLGVLGESAYWEFNLSPSGDWNVYSMTAYRQGQAPELTYEQLEVHVTGPLAAPRLADCRLSGPRALLELETHCPLPPMLQACRQSGHTLEVGLSAVLESQSGALSFWALRHPGPEPDFHDRGGWLLRL
jgi:hypothetical protein